MALLCGATQAQMTSAAIPTQRVPDVQVVVFPLPTHEWAITTVYPKIIARTTAEARVKRLLGITGWEGSTTEFKNKALERVAANAPPSPPMSSLTFRTPGRVVNLSDGTMPLEPFIRAFRDLERVHITYIIPGNTFTFRGLREYSGQDIEIALSQGEGAYTYVLNIKNHNLDTLQLPRYETLKPGSGTTTTQVTPKSGFIAPAPVVVGTGLAVLLAAGAGTAAYLFFTRVAVR